MKWTKVLILAMAFSALGGSVLSAEASSQEPVQIVINGQAVKEGGYVIGGTTYVPLRDFNGLVSYDSSTGKVQFEQPNVHIFLFKGDTVFGNVNKGKLKFNVFSQIDSLTTDIVAVKIAIIDPDGNVKDIQSQEMTGKSKDNFWFRTHDFTYDFKKAGKYKVGFYIQETPSSKFKLISEKVITALDS